MSCYEGKPRNMKDRLSEADLDLFKRLYLERKKTNAEIGEIIGISQPSVKRLAKKLKLPNKYDHNHPEYKKRINRSIFLYNQGKSTKKVGKILGLNDETVRRYIKESGVQMRESNGLTKEKIAQQNKIIKQMYENGAQLKEITKKSGVGRHGLDKRLAAMGIKRVRLPYQPLGSKYDTQIEQMFRNGKKNVEIAEELKIGQETVKYRIANVIFKGREFKIRWKSNYTGKWTTNSRRYQKVKEIYNAKRKIISGQKKVDIEIIPVKKEGFV